MAMSDIDSMIVNSTDLSNVVSRGIITSTLAIGVQEKHIFYSKTH